MTGDSLVTANGAPFSHLSITETSICLICERLCHSDNKHCPACTSNKLVSLANFREDIMWLAVRDSKETL